jgi:hypothetical protein
VLESCRGAEHFEQAIWDDVQNLIADPDRLAREYRRRLTECDADRNRPSRRVRQLLDGVRPGISRLIDAYQDGLIGKGEFEPRLTKARERQLALEKELALAVEQERDKDHISAILGEFCAFAKAIEANLKDADLQSRIKILRLLIKQIEVGEEEICVVYKLGSCPFEQRPVTGHFQNRSRRKTVAVKVEDLDPVPAAIQEKEEMAVQGILPKVVVNQPGEAVEAFRQVGRPGAEENPDGQWEHNHGLASLRVRPASEATTRPNHSGSGRASN